MFALRHEIISAADVATKTKEYRRQINQELVEDCIPKNSYSEQWEIDLLTREKCYRTLKKA